MTKQIQCSNPECDARTDPDNTAPVFSVRVQVDEDRNVEENMDKIPSEKFECCFCHSPAEDIPAAVTIRDVVEQGLTERPEGMSDADWDYSGVAAHDVVEFEGPLSDEEREKLQGIADGLLDSLPEVMSVQQLVDWHEWTDSSVANILWDYVNNQGDDEAVREHFQKQADLENGG